MIVGGTNAAYLFDGNTGELLHTFSSPDGYSWSFGYTVAAVGEDVLVAAPFANTAAGDAGAAYLFDGSTGELRHTFVSPDPDRDDRFGRYLAGVGNNVLIATNGEDTRSADGGAAYLFDGATGALIRSFIGNGGSFGAVAAAGENVLAGGTEGVHLYNGATGEIMQTYFSPRTYTSSFGQALGAIDGKVLVGAPYDYLDYSCGVNGVVYVYDMESGELTQTLARPDQGAGGTFGQSIAVGGGQALVGQDSQWSGQSMIQAYTFGVTPWYATATMSLSWRRTTWPLSPRGAWPS